MCSNSLCDIAGLMSGPVGNLVGLGIKALVNGSPIGSRSAENYRKSNIDDEIPQFYNDIEAHLKGTLRVLKPALEINRMLMGECKSADRGRQALIPETPIVYYTPQNSKRSNSSYRSNDVPSLKKPSEHHGHGKSVSSATSHSHRDRLPDQINSQGKNSSSADKCSKKVASKKCCSPILSQGPSCGVYDNREKSCKKKSSSSKQSCANCNISLKEKSLLAVLPCKHLFCYSCLAKDKSLKCQKCDKSFNMQNITQISTIP